MNTYEKVLFFFLQTTFPLTLSECSLRGTSLDPFLINSSVLEVAQNICESGENYILGEHWKYLQHLKRRQGFLSRWQRRETCFAGNRIAWLITEHEWHPQCISLHSPYVPYPLLCQRLCCCTTSPYAAQARTCSSCRLSITSYSMCWRVPVCMHVFTSIRQPSSRGSCQKVVALVSSARKMRVVQEMQPGWLE